MTKSENIEITTYLNYMEGKIEDFPCATPKQFVELGDIVSQTTKDVSRLKTLLILMGAKDWKTTANIILNKINK